MPESKILSSRFDFFYNFYDFSFKNSLKMGSKIDLVSNSIFGVKFWLKRKKEMSQFFDSIFGVKKPALF